MIKTPLFLLLVLPFIVPAQSKNDTVGYVKVTVTDMKGNPKPGEEVLFRSDKTARVISAVSDATGKMRQALLPGDKYIVSLKSIGDTTSYALVDVPKLEPGEFFTEDFWVNIKFEPARKYRLDHVHFDTDKASLRPGSEQELGDLVLYLQRHPDIKVEIAGHTDNTGDPTSNLLLSQHRAITIRDYLVKKGIKSIRITPKGYGATEPVGNNETEGGRQLNRRTEVRILP